MITLEHLDVRQQKELAEYRSERDKRLFALNEEQAELLKGVSCTTPKAHDLLHKMLDEQQQQFNQTEQDELDLLNHFHSLEREQLMKKEEVREKLSTDIQEANKSKDRGR